MSYSLCLFDLDGTLTDPKEGITKSVCYALKAFGIEVKNLDTLTKFIGPPLRESFCEYYGFSEKDAEAAVTKYREYFSTKGIFENKIYPGVTDMLKRLKGSGITLAMATSKPTIFASKIAEHFGFRSYLDFIAGSELDDTRSRKGEVISYALEKLGHLDLASAVMVGDRKHDIIGAQEVGIDSVGVTWGYGSRGELINAGPTYIVKSTAKLIQLILEES